MVFTDNLQFHYYMLNSIRVSNLSRKHKLIQVIYVLAIVIHTSPVFMDKKNFYDIANPLLYLNKIVEEHKVYFLKKNKIYIYTNTHI